MSRHVYEGFKTFSIKIDEGVMWVTIDFPPVNLQGPEMLADLAVEFGSPEGKEKSGRKAYSQGNDSPGAEFRK